jgi:hypothetical protein
MTTATSRIGSAPDTGGSLLDGARRERVPAGGILLEPGALLHEAPFLVSGEVEVWREGRLLRAVAAPAWLELAAVAAGRPTRTRAVAWDQVEVAWVPRARLLERSDRLAGELARAALELEEDAFEEVVRCDDFFDPPNARLVPGPYRFGPFGAHVMVVETEEERLRELLAPGLEPLAWTGGRYLLLISDFEDVRSESPLADGARYRYRETTPFLPCRLGHRVGLFSPELYPDSYMPILLGREIYGFPKRMGRTRRLTDGVDVIVDQERLLRARWGAPRPLDGAAAALELGGALLPGLVATSRRRRLLQRAGRFLERGALPRGLRRSRAFVRKQILSESRLEPRGHAIDQLVEVPFDLFQLDRVERLERFEVSFGERQRILSGTVLAVFSARVDFGFAAGIRRIDYLADRHRADRARGRWGSR